MGVEERDRAHRTVPSVIVEVDLESKLSRRIPRPDALLFPSLSPEIASSEGFESLSSDPNIRFKLVWEPAGPIEGKTSSSWSRSASILDGFLAAGGGEVDIEIYACQILEDQRGS